VETAILYIQYMNKLNKNLFSSLYTSTSSLYFLFTSTSSVCIHPLPLSLHPLPPPVSIRDELFEAQTYLSGLLTLKVALRALSLDSAWRGGTGRGTVTMREGGGERERHYLCLEGHCHHERGGERERERETLPLPGIQSRTPLPSSRVPATHTAGKQGIQ